MTNATPDIHTGAYVCDVNPRAARIKRNNITKLVQLARGRLKKRRVIKYTHEQQTLMATIDATLKRFNASTFSLVVGIDGTKISLRLKR